jgi:hypothetical protein
MDLGTIHAYRALGGNLFPTCSGAVGDPARKRPLLRGWQKRQYPDEFLLAYANAGHGIAWAIPEGLVVFDVDVASPARPAKQGATSWGRLEAKIGQLLHYGVTTATGGRHYYFRTGFSELEANKSAYPDIDIKRPGGYVLIAGSCHWEGGYYQASPSVYAYGLRPEYIPVAPDRLLLEFLKKTQTASHKSVEVLPVGKVARLLDLLDPNDFASNDTWLPIAMAVHSATGGSDEGLDAFASWCAKDPQYADDTTIPARWYSFDAKGPVTSATLLKAVRQSINGSTQAVRAFNEILGLTFDDAVSLFGTNTIPSEQLNEQKLPQASVGQPDTISVAEPTQPREQAIDRAVVMTNGNDELKVLTDVVQCLPGVAETCGFFQRGAELVHVLSERTERGVVRANIRPVPPPVLRAAVTGSVNFQKTIPSKDGSWQTVPCPMPGPTANALSMLGNWPGTQRLRRLVTGPVLATSTTAVIKPGYYRDLALLYSGQDLNVPRYQLSREGAQWSASNLLDLVCDFPFAKPSHKSAWLSFLLTLVARPSIHGPVPLNLVVSTDKDSGKTLLCKLASSIATGDFDTAPMSATDEAEFEKRMVSMLLCGHSVIVMDNEKNASDIGGPWLDQFLTSAQITSRILGESRAVTFDNDVTLAMTGNSLRVNPDADTIRRIVVTYLDKGAQAKRVFKHGNEDQLIAMVKMRRGMLLGDVFNIFMAYAQAGRPRFCKPYSSYEDWDAIVRQSILWLGLPDPLDGLKDAPDTLDSQAETRSICVEALLMLLIRKGQPATTNELMDLIKELKGASAYGVNDPVIAAVREAANSTRRDFEQLNSQRLGVLFRSNANIWGASEPKRRIIRVGSAGNAAKWWFENAADRVQT